jgi:DNA-binding PadR family transcriptional regulator
MKIRLLLFIGCLATLVQCKSNTKSDGDTTETNETKQNNEAPQFVYEISKEEKSKPKKAKPKLKLEVSISDDIIKNKALQLESVYDYVPFFYEKNGIAFFYVVKGEFKGSNPFDNNKYGLVDTSGHVILDCIYDKIYTPNLVFDGCVEIEKDGLVGLFNFKSNETLEPQFKYIITDSTNTSYALYKNALLKVNQDFEIDYEDHYALMHVLPKFSFIGPNEAEKGFLIFNYTTDIVLLNGFDNNDHKVLISPSFLSYNDLLPQIVGNLNIDHGSGPYAKIIDQNKTDKGIFSAILEFYDGTFGVRDMTPIYTEAVSFSIENNHPNFTSLQQTIGWNDKYVKLKNDSILEKYWTESELDLDPCYRFYKLTEKGVNELTTFRKFHFTKYVKIDTTYLQGPFNIEMNDSLRKVFKERFIAKKLEYDLDEYMQYVHAKISHFTVEELDVMRNEIFAEYGYKFKSKKWQNYFSTFSWYKPRFDNVDQKLTEIDKHNIKVILKQKADIESGKIKVKITPYTYSAAG